MEAQYQLGMLYLQGEGVTASDEEAMKWLWYAADRSYLQAGEILEYCLTTTFLTVVDQDIPVAHGFSEKRGASLVPESKARRRVIASPIARRRNAAIGCERRASRPKTHV